MTHDRPVPARTLADYGIHEGMTDTEIQDQLQRLQVEHAQRVYADLVTAGLQRPLTENEVLGAMALVGRVPAVTLIADLATEWLLPREVATRVVPEAWSLAEFPGQQLDPNTWRWLFDLAGYTVDGKRALRPPKMLTLYRGATAEHRDGWSWTDQLDIARRYASGNWYRRRAGAVWVTTAGPSSVLARITDRDEHEYVIDTADLAIKEHQ